MAKNKTRLDVALVEQGFAESREKAKAIIMSGIVYVNNQKSDKLIAPRRSRRGAFVDVAEMYKFSSQRLKNDGLSGITSS